MEEPNIFPHLDSDHVRKSKRDKIRIKEADRDPKTYVGNTSFSNKLKTNGFDLPLNPLQIFSWIFTLVNVIFYYACNLPPFQIEIKVIQGYIYI